MFVIADSFDAHKIGELLTGADTQLLETLTVIEVELTDLSAGKAQPDPTLGIAQALAYASKGYPTVVVARRAYEEIPDWAMLNSMENVFICSALSRENLVRAIQTLA